MFNKKENILFIVLIFVILLNSYFSPYFFDLTNLIDSTFLFSEKGIIALSMTFLIISRQIDLSVASIVALSACVLGYLSNQDLPIIMIILLTLFCGVVCGYINGFLVTYYNIPSIIVTIGTLSLFRGISYVVLEDQYYTNLPNFIINLGNGYLFGAIPYSFSIFLALSFIISIFLHKTIFGKKIFMIGNNPETSEYSGIKVKNYLKMLFVLNGLFSSLAAILLSGRLSSIKPNIAFGWELEIITMVVFGGVYIYGGSGSILGVVISIFILGLVTFGLSLLNIPGVGIIIFTGLLLILTIAVTSYFKNETDKNY